MEQYNDFIAFYYVQCEISDEKVSFDLKNIFQKLKIIIKGERFY